MSTAIDKERDRVIALSQMVIRAWRLLDGLSVAPEVTLVALAVRLGWYQKRPLDVSAIATMTGLPRSTVNRHIKALEGLNRMAATRIGRRSVPLPTSMDAAEIGRFLASLEALVVSTAAVVSKMGT